MRNEAEHERSAKATDESEYEVDIVHELLARIYIRKSVIASLFTSFLSTPYSRVTPSTMAVATDVQLILRQARDGRMARSKLIEVIIAREGNARRAKTIAEVEKVIAFQLEKGRIRSETKNGVEFLIFSR